MHTSVPQKIYNITKRLRTVDEVEKYFPGFMAFIDCTEQQIPRPVDKKRRNAHYSGKKKRHIPNSIIKQTIIFDMFIARQITLTSSV